MSHRPRKRFGQNFLVDPSVIDRIITCISPAHGERLVEIGPGRGAITVALLNMAGALDVVELDRDLVLPLAELCRGQGELRVHNCDALKFDFCRLAKEEERLRVVGNLPYNISTPILFHLLDQASCIRDMHFMLQKEVVDRMAASPGTKAYGRLTIMLQTRCRVEPLFQIGPDAFRPTPKVNSSFVRLVPHQEPRFAIDDPALFRRIVAQAFSLRRKTLRNSLKDLVSVAQMSDAAVDPGQRAERLTIEAFVQLANNACKTLPAA